jgi:hypothetical protein
VKLTEAPPTAEAAANPASPVRKVTLRPTRSASRPQNSSRLPNDSEYAVTTHCRSAFVNPSARCADGSARFITVTSRTIMSAAKQMVARTSHRRESASPELTMLLKRLVGAWMVDIWFLRVARNIRLVLTSGVRLSLTPGLRTSGRRGDSRVRIRAGTWCAGAGMRVSAVSPALPFVRYADRAEEFRRLPCSTR